MKTSTIKANGIHYTPPELADFLATVTAEQAVGAKKSLEVLDPACGDGALLYAFARTVPESVRRGLVLVGYDTNPEALKEAGLLLRKVEVRQVILEQRDFLQAAAPTAQQRTFFDSGESTRMPGFDVVISNPPYVRTQILGAARAQSLARQFGLTGRVDLYHAFTIAMANVLQPGGVLGLLTSNRFLTIKSGASLRQLLSKKFDLRAIYDLGDTKLFGAAVLPVVVVGKKSDQGADGPCPFDRVYEDRSSGVHAQNANTILEAIRNRDLSGLVRTPSGVHRIERGFLSNNSDDAIWTLATEDYQDWLAVVNKHSHYTFDDVARIRVGIKTTADEVFIREDWDDLPARQQPETELIHPLIRHFDATRWVWSGENKQTVLYPHVAKEGKQRPIDLHNFPRAWRYLEAHRDRLTRRHYVIDGGRQWYEIWVPHNPDEWAKPKIVFPDIAEEPRFFLDNSGAIVNGDCYWMTLRPGFNHDHLMLMLAVANSTFITRYYDMVFHNKLYAGRRRFMTQYVKRFPLPDVTCTAARKAIQCALQLVTATAAVSDLENEADELVWQSFGLVKEVDSATVVL
jgi:adenine-specific DNA-methyltransferase